MPQPEDSPLRPDPPSRRVLVVDDDADTCDLLVTLLAMAGHQTVIARDAPEALQLAERFCPEAEIEPGVWVVWRDPTRRAQSSEGTGVRVTRERRFTKPHLVVGFVRGIIRLTRGLSVEEVLDGAEWQPVSAEEAIQTLDPDELAAMKHKLPLLCTRVLP